MQTFVLGTVSAAIIALPLATLTAFRKGAALLRDFFWPDQFDPYIAFSAFFIAILFVLLGYFHLGRLGAILSLGLGACFAWLLAVCAYLCFMLATMELSVATYGVCFLLAYLLMFWLHKKAIASPSIRNAQRKMQGSHGC